MFDVFSFRMSGVILIIMSLYKMLFFFKKNLYLNFHGYTPISVCVRNLLQPFTILGISVIQL